MTMLKPVRIAIEGTQGQDVDHSILDMKEGMVPMFKTVPFAVKWALKHHNGEPLVFRYILSPAQMDVQVDYDQYKQMGAPGLGQEDILAKNLMDAFLNILRGVMTHGVTLPEKPKVIPGNRQNVNALKNQMRKGGRIIS